MPRSSMLQKGQKLITSFYKPARVFKHINQFGTLYSKTKFDIGSDDPKKINFRNKFYGLVSKHIHNDVNLMLLDHPNGLPCSKLARESGIKNITAMEFNEDSYNLAKTHKLPGMNLFFGPMAYYPKEFPTAKFNAIYLDGVETLNGNDISRKNKFTTRDTIESMCSVMDKTCVFTIVMTTRSTSALNKYGTPIKGRHLKNHQIKPIIDAIFHKNNISIKSFELITKGARSMAYYNYVLTNNN